MFSRLIYLLPLIILLVSCNIREDNSLPSGVSPFDLLDDALYIDSQGIYDIGIDSLRIRVTLKSPETFSFVEDTYEFIPCSDSYLIELINNDGANIFLTDFNLLLAFPSSDFDYLGLKFQGAYERFYPYPKSATIDAFGAFYEKDFCYFIFNDSGYYQTVKEDFSLTSTKVHIDPQATDDINVSLYQAQFILPRSLLPLGVNQISLDKIDSIYQAEYELRLSSLPLNFNIIQNNPGQERYPILYIPLEPSSDFSKINVRQILRNGSQVFFTYSDVVNNYNEYTVYGNNVILLVNNQGRFIIEQ